MENLTITEEFELMYYLLELLDAEEVEADEL